MPSSLWLGDAVYALGKQAVLRSRGDMGYEITQDASSLAYDRHRPSPIFTVR
jgi:hypothetical protein